MSKPFNIHDWQDKQKRLAEADNPAFKINPSDVGPTTTHEHILIDFLCMFNPPSEASERFKAFQPVTMENLGWVRYDHFRNQDNLLLADEDVAVQELLLFKGHGGNTIIDATTIGIGRDPFALSRIANFLSMSIELIILSISSTKSVFGNLLSIFMLFIVCVGS